MTIKLIKNSVLAIAALISFFVLLSEESHINPMPFAQFILIKVIALVVFAGCLQAFGVLDVKEFFKEEKKA
jgi:hypothetical protein